MHRLVLTPVKGQLKPAVGISQARIRHKQIVVVFCVTWTANTSETEVT